MVEQGCPRHPSTLGRLLLVPAQYHKSLPKSWILLSLEGTLAQVTLQVIARLHNHEVCRIHEESIVVHHPILNKGLFEQCGAIHPQGECCMFTTPCRLFKMIYPLEVICGGEELQRLWALPSPKSQACLPRRQCAP